MTTPYKLCPRCRSGAPLNAAQCAHCGHIFRTQFTAQATAAATATGATVTIAPYDVRTEARARIRHRQMRTALLCVITVFSITWSASVVWLYCSPIFQMWQIGLMPQNWGAAGPAGVKAQAVLTWVLGGSVAVLLAFLWGVASLIHKACLRVTEAMNAVRARRVECTQVDLASLAWHERYRPLLIAAGFAVFLIANNPSEDDLARWANAQASALEQQPSSAAGRAGQALGMAMAPALVRSITTRYNLLLGSVFVVRLNGGGGVFLGAARQIIPLQRAPQPSRSDSPPQ